MNGTSEVSGGEAKANFGPAGRRRETAAQDLCAFYDLEVCSVTFDFLNWLLRAEMYRRESGRNGIHVVFVPGSVDGFNPHHYDSWIKRWRLNTILTSACALMPTVNKITVCASREEAGEIEDASADACFPIGYTPRMYDSEKIYERSRTALLDAWLLGGTVARHVLGEKIPILTPTKRAKRYVKEYLEQRARGRKIVVLTWRESQHAASRNAIIDDWIRFALQLDPDVYFPVVVRDTLQLYSEPGDIEGITSCPAASANLDIRVALYEAAYLNLTLDTGPLAICYLNPQIRYIAYRFFRNSDEDGFIASLHMYGIPIFGQVPFANEFQRIVWDNDQYDVLCETFDEMVARIDAAEQGKAPLALERRSNIPPEEALSIAMTLHMGDQLGAAESIYGALLERNPGDSNAKAMLGLLRHHVSDRQKAVALLLEAIEERNDVATYYFNLGVVLQASGELETADAVFAHALSLDPQAWPAWANRGEICHSLGALENAAQYYRRAVEGGATDCRTLHEYATALNGLGHHHDACGIFGRLREHYMARIGLAAGAGSNFEKLAVLRFGQIAIPSDRHVIQLFDPWG